MLEILREKPKVYKGEFIDENTYSMYKTFIQESGGEIMLHRGPGDEVATIDGSINLEKGQHFVGLAFKTEEKYEAFKERVNTPQVMNG